MHFENIIEDKMQDIDAAVRRLDKALTTSNTEFFTTLYGQIASSIVNNAQGFVGAAGFEDYTGRDNWNFGVRMHTSRNASADSFSEGASIPSGGNQTVKTYTTAYMNYGVPCQISGSMLAGITGPDAISDLLDKEMAFAYDDMVDILEQHSFALQDSPAPTTVDIENLDRIVDDTDGAAAVYGLERTSSAGDDWMDAYVNGNSGTLRSATMKLIDEMLDTASSRVGKMPSLIVCPYAIRTVLEGVYRQYITAPNPTLNFKPGWILSEIKGIPVLPSQHCWKDSETSHEDDIAYFLQLQDLKFRYLRSAGAAGMIDVQFDTTAADSTKAWLKLRTQLVATQFRGHGVLTDIQ